MAVRLSSSTSPVASPLKLLRFGQQSAVSSLNRGAVMADRKLNYQQLEDEFQALHQEKSLGDVQQTLRERLHTLSEQIEGLVEKRNTGLLEQNDAILKLARERNLVRENLSLPPVPVQLGQFEFRTMMGMPVGEANVMEFIHNGGSYKPVTTEAVFILPIANIDGKKHVIFIESDAYALPGKRVIELPGGVVKEGVDPKEVGLSEVLEEAGYGFERPKVQVMGTLSEVPSFIQSVNHFLLVEGKPIQGEPLQEIQERLANMEAVVVPLEELSGWLKEQQSQNKVIKSATLAALYMYQQKMQNPKKANPFQYTPGMIPQ